MLTAHVHGIYGVSQPTCPMDIPIRHIVSLPPFNISHIKEQSDRKEKKRKEKKKYTVIVYF
jgi:hypothetical protein